MPKILRLAAGLTIALAESVNENEVAGQLEQYIKDRVEESTKLAVEPIQTQLKDATEKAEKLQTVLVGEVIRLRKIADDSLDVEKETEYLSVLPADRLELEFDRAAKASVSVKRVSLSPEANDADEQLVSMETVK